MDNLSTILAAVDFGRASEAALAQALRIGPWNRASVHALHVVDTGILLEAQEALSTLQRDIQAALESDAAERWAKFMPALAGKAECRFHVMVNNPRFAVLELARRLGADLLVLGVRGDDAGGRGPGPLATACVQGAGCPVLLATEGQVGAFKQVMACTDFSETSVRALKAAARVAVQDGAALHVVHVYRAPWRDSRLLMLPEVDQETQGRYIEGMRRKVANLCAVLGEEATYLKPHVEVVDHHSHGRGIVEYARRINADLIVLGTRGRTNLRDVMLGSTAERVVRSAGRSVLTVRAG